MNRSRDRYTFQLKAYIERCEIDGQEPREDYMNMYLEESKRALENEANEEWKKYNLEYDLRSTTWICDKAKAREEYAQNIYAALCNNEFVKNDVWPLLKDQRWSCSWRYAGGIVADMREQGDYIDWYCSGIRQGYSEDEDPLYATNRFVPEGHVTTEIEEDLLRLGWIPVPWDDD